MVQVVVQTPVPVSREECFDLARNIRIHEQTTSHTRERVVEVRSPSGNPKGDLLELGDVVTFEAVHLGIRQRLTSKIVAFDRPSEFVDEMQRGAFKSLRHIHRFEPSGFGTNMIDIVEFEAPGWIFGRLAEVLVLKAYMRRFLKSRGQELARLTRSRE